jgi:hypothetical protein
MVTQEATIRDLLALSSKRMIQVRIIVRAFTALVKTYKKLHDPHTDFRHTNIRHVAVYVHT